MLEGRIEENRMRREYYLRVLSPLVFLTLSKWRAILEISSFTSVGIVTRVDDIVEKKTPLPS